MQKRRFWNYFIPNAENDYAPHGLQIRAIGGMLLLAVITFIVANVYSIVVVTTDWLSSAVIPAVIVDLTNEERTELAVGDLERDSLLDEVAQTKAEHMAREGYFAHNSPDGRTPWDWFAEAGYAYRHAGENLAVHFSDSRAAVDAWMDSPAHRANILNGQYTKIGIGVARGRFEGSSTLFVVQMFATPVSATTTTTFAAERSATTSESVLAETVQSSGVLGEAADAEVASSSASSAPRMSDFSATSAAPTRATSDVGRATSDMATHTEAALLSEESGPHWSAALLTQPTLWLSAIYLLLALYITVVLTLSVVIEWRRQHPTQLTYGVGLLCVLAVLLHVHTSILGRVLIA